MVRLIRSEVTEEPEPSTVGPPSSYGVIISIKMLSHTCAKPDQLSTNVLHVARVLQRTSSEILIARVQLAQSLSARTITDLQ